MQGVHLTYELHGCSPAASALMRDVPALRSLCLQAVRVQGLNAVGELFHAFPPPGGVTGVVLLAESHVALHTWPEREAVTLDVYVCNASADHAAQAEALGASLCAAFDPQRVTQGRLLRGTI
jgi:S-adenosylmethionine decarboxylase